MSPKRSRRRTFQRASAAPAGAYVVGYGRDLQAWTHVRQFMVFANRALAEEFIRTHRFVEMEKSDGDRGRSDASSRQLDTPLDDAQGGAHTARGEGIIVGHQQDGSRVR